MTFQERRNLERLKKIDQLFQLLQYTKEELETVEYTYLNYKIELINIQKKYIEMRKFVIGDNNV